MVYQTESTVQGRRAGTNCKADTKAKKLENLLKKEYTNLSKLFAPVGAPQMPFHPRSNPDEVKSHSTLRISKNSFIREP